MSAGGRSLQGLAKAPGKGHSDRAAIPAVAESRLRLLEIDVTMGCIRQENIVHCQFQGCFFFHDLFADGYGGGSEGLYNHLSFDALGTVPSGYFTPPPFREGELVIHIQ